MTFPTLKPPAAGQQIIDVFGGYDHRDRIAAGSFYETENLSSDAYPCASPRKARGVRKKSAGRRATAMLPGHRLIYAADGKLWVEDEPVMELTDEEPKTLIAMGAYVVVLPDKVYYNTADPEDRGAAEAAFEAAGNATYRICRSDGTDYESAPAAQSSAPEDPADQDLWIDTSGEKHVLKQYAASSGMWTIVATTYVRISAEGIGAGFFDGDGVRIGGIPEEAGQLTEFNGKDVILTHVEADAVVITGILDAEVSAPGLTLSRRWPELDYAFECGNRLWGCRYGKDADGKFVNEIYASKLGDLRNWRCYAGVSTDSYAATVGSDGPFTGACALNGYPLFFKEHCLHKVYGAYPAAYQIQQYAGFEGVEAGSGGSLTAAAGLLYYKSSTGICVYDGASPRLISEALGNERYHAATAGTWENKLYVSMLDEMETAHMFVYDLARGIWYREDGARAEAFAAAENTLYYIENGEIRTVRGEDGKRVIWRAETGPMGLGETGQKRVIRLTLRVTLTMGSRMTVYILYDDETVPVHAATVTGASMRSFTLPILPRRCDHFRLRLEGEGQFLLHSIAQVTQEGSVIT